MNNQRIKALGEYEMLKKQLTDLGLRSGVMLAGLRDTLGFTEDFMEIDFPGAGTIIKDLSKMQKKAGEIAERMNTLNETFNFESE
jgi:hypothetical protein